jgi:vacuolar-type H+-ATPase subunit I/STV1
MHRLEKFMDRYKANVFIDETSAEDAPEGMEHVQTIGNAPTTLPTAPEGYSSRPVVEDIDLPNHIGTEINKEGEDVDNLAKKASAATENELPQINEDGTVSKSAHTYSSEPDHSPKTRAVRQTGSTDSSEPTFPQHPLSAEHHDHAVFGKIFKVLEQLNNRQDKLSGAIKQIAGKISTESSFSEEDSDVEPRKKEQAVAALAKLEDTIQELKSQKAALASVKQNLKASMEQEEQ